MGGGGQAMKRIPLIKFPQRHPKPTPASGLTFLFSSPISHLFFYISDLVCILSMEALIVPLSFFSRVPQLGLLGLDSAQLVLVV